MLFSGDTETFITNILYLGLATCQFMEIHNILSLCYGGYNLPSLKNSTFTEYEGTSRQRSGKGAIRKRFPQKHRGGKTKINNQVLIP